MSRSINEVTAYVFGKPKPTSPKEAYGHSNAAGRGYYTMKEMSDERTDEFMRAQKRSNNMVNVEGDMVGSWNLEF
jgi:hypothetical protein